MPEYIDVPIETDPDELSQEAFDFLRSLVPGWVPSEANLEVWLIRACARMAAEVRDLSSQAPTSIFRYFGANVIRIPPIDATPALGLTTWTMTDSQGYTIPAGTLVGIRTSGDTLIPFRTTNEATILPGNTATAAGEVGISAVDAGASGSGLSGSIELIDAIDNVQSVALTASTAGGVDAETDQEYLDRLSTQLQLLAPRPILPADFAALALNVAGVGRALAIDGYNPTDESSNNERMVTVAVTDSSGSSVTNTVKSNVQDYLQERREANFVVNVIDATYTQIDVNFTAMALPGFDDSDVVARVISALQGALSPAAWGQPPVGDQLQWLNHPKVRYLEIASIVNNVEGVDYIETLVIGVHSSTLQNLDIDLPGIAPLPQVGVISGSIDTP